MKFLGMNLFELILGIPVFFLAISFHEFAHGKVADLLGDPTPRRAGRLTLHPLAHFDLFGFLTLVLTRRVGWAKPVPVQPGYFKNPRKGMLWVGLAGPLANLLLATVAAIAINVWEKFDPFLAYKFNTNLLNSLTYTILFFLIYVVIINVGFAVFNLLPIPPLDGSRVLAGLLPGKYARIFDYLEQYMMFFIIVLIFAGEYVGRLIEPVIQFILRLMGLA